jgi:hypothetical protein
VWRPCTCSTPFFGPKKNKCNCFCPQPYATRWISHETDKIHKLFKQFCLQSNKHTLSQTTVS